MAKKKTKEFGLKSEVVKAVKGLDRFPPLALVRMRACNLEAIGLEVPPGSEAHSVVPVRVGELRKAAGVPEPNSPLPLAPGVPEYDAEIDKQNTKEEDK